MTRSEYPLASWRRAFVQWAISALACASVLRGATPAAANATASTSAGTIAWVGARIFPAPEAPVIDRGVVLVTDGTITAVGSADEVEVPAEARIIDAAGLSLLAGFWNCHVHFTEPKWWDAANRPAEQLREDLQQMLTRYGFTTAVDLASLIDNTTRLRARIESGEVPGPRILTAGSALYPVEGVPYYVTDTAPELATLLPTPATAEEAVAAVQRTVDGGADVIKLFLVTGVRGGDRSIELRSMSPEVVRAAVQHAHRQGRLVFAHPSTVKGLNAALDHEVDVLAHTIQDTENWNATVVGRMRDAGIALVPTLHLFSRARDFPAVQRQVRDYVAAGGDVLFGTDVGFLSDYVAVSRELKLLADAGLSFPQLLATLTTAPATRFGVGDRSGRIAPGADADLVLVAGDPREDVEALLRVRSTVRAGRIIFERP